MPEPATSHGVAPRVRQRLLIALVAVAVVTAAATVIVLMTPEPAAFFPSPWPDSPASSGAGRPGIAETTDSAQATATPDEEPPRPQRMQTPLTQLAFNVENAMVEVRALEAFGVRAAGSEAERQAVDYIAARLSNMGYSPVVIEDVPLPDGRVSHNVSARTDGTSPRMIVLGAHVDSKPPSPGAHDNATGCGALLEIARILAVQPVTAQVEFIFFGAEETIDKDPNHHHFGSRRRVATLTEAEKANIAGMVSVDMIGYGPDFVARTMLRGPQSMRDLLLATSKAAGAGLTFLKDPGKTGWSDHEAYELAGIPAVWIEWRDDPVYHTAKDTSAHIRPEKVRVAGQLVLDVLRGLGEDALEELAAR
jgi:aminopeptidase YwaD